MQTGSQLISRWMLPNDARYSGKRKECVGGWGVGGGGGRRETYPELFWKAQRKGAMVSIWVGGLLYKNVNSSVQKIQTKKAPLGLKL